MTSEQLKAWREEFEKDFPSSIYSGKKYISDFDGSVCYESLDTTRLWGCYKAARKKAHEEYLLARPAMEDSFYKLGREFTEKQMNEEIKTIKEEHLVELEKRDKLLERAIPYVKKFQVQSVYVDDISGTYSLIEDYEELKK